MREIKVVFSIRIAPTMRDAIEHWAAVLGMSAGEFIRSAAIEYAKSQGVYHVADLVSSKDESHTKSIT